MYLVSLCVHPSPAIHRLATNVNEALKGVDREKSAVFKELTQSFRTYELRGQAMSFAAKR